MQVVAGKGTRLTAEAVAAAAKADKTDGKPQLEVVVKAHMLDVLEVVMGAAAQG